MHRAGIDQRVKITALAAKVIGQRRGVAQDIGHQLQQARPRLKQAENIYRAWHGFDHIVETGDSAIAVRRLRHRGHDRRQDSLERIARRCASDRADLAAAPPFQSLHHACRISIAQIGQLLLKRQAFIRHARAFAPICIDHAVVDRRDLSGDRLDCRNQCIGIGQSMQPRHGICGVAVGRNLVRLAVAMHLQAMFDRTQIVIRRCQGLCLLRCDWPSRRQCRKRLSRIRHAQARIAAAVNQLMRLRKKFTFPDPAMAALQVKA